VDAVGNLCYNAKGSIAASANTGTAAMNVDRPSYLARAFMRSTADARFDKTEAAKAIGADTS